MLPLMRGQGARGTAPVGPPLAHAVAGEAGEAR
jgi:hypothetical protein